MDIKKIIESFIPFVLIGAGIALFVWLLLMFFSIALWGLVIGGVLWLASLVKQYLFPSSSPVSKEKGRIIEHKDNK